MSLSARPYAVAFLDTAPRGYDVPAFLSAAGALSKALSGDTRLRAFFGSPAVPEAVKAKALSELSRKAGLDDLGGRFLRLVLSRRRLLHLGEILSAIGMESDHREGVVQATVRVASPVTDAEHRAIEASVSSRVGRKVRATVELDPAILAGFVARVGSEVFDASADHAIERFRQQAKEQRK